MVQCYAGRRLGAPLNANVDKVPELKEEERERKENKLKRQPLLNFKDTFSKTSDDKNNT